MNKKLLLPNVTVIIVDCYNYGLATASLKKAIDLVDFGAVKFLTDVDMEIEGVEVVKIPRINSKDEYSKFIIKELYKYIETPHILIIQHDSGIWFPEAWDDDFLRYSAIGAAWIYIDGRNNSNGGFSLRTKEFCELIAKDDFIDIYHPEDEVLFRLYRKYLEQKYKCVFPDDETCDRFSFELRTPYCKSFGYHGNFHSKFKEHIVIKRTHALGDLCMVEPLFAYYSQQGYQVVVDTLPQFMEIFSRYKYPLIHISQMNPKITPIKMINLDMAYENKPQQLVLKSYIELTGENIPLRNSKLYFPVDNGVHMFDNLILIHADSTNISHRDQHGINWQFVVAYYERLGYQIFQIGKRMQNQIAPYINTATLETLMFMISGAKLLIGLDSSPLQMAVALGVPAVGFFGSVDWKLRYLPTDKLIALHTDCPSGKERHCYHEINSTTIGKACDFDATTPPCSVFSEYDIIAAANKLLKLN